MINQSIYRVYIEPAMIIMMILQHDDPFKNTQNSFKGIK